MGKEFLNSYTESELKSVQLVEIEILKIIIQICNKHNIPYFAIGGTLLGCIRHNGFIPRDDDIDIGMLRDDYEKFLKICIEELPNGYYVMHHSINNKYPHYHAKICKENTEFREDATFKLKYRQGIFVDIMPFDKVPVDSKERKKYYRKINILTRLYQVKKIWRVPSTSEHYNYFFRILKIILHISLSLIPEQFLFERLDKNIQKYDDSKSDIFTSRGYDEFEANLINYFPLVKCRFEELEINVPQNSKFLLKLQYGDYMKLPPIEKRIGHKPKYIQF